MQKLSETNRWLHWQTTIAEYRQQVLMDRLFRQDLINQCRRERQRQTILANAFYRQKEKEQEIELGLRQPFIPQWV